MYFNYASEECYKILNEGDSIINLPNYRGNGMVVINVADYHSKINFLLVPLLYKKLRKGQTKFSELLTLLNRMSFSEQTILKKLCSFHLHYLKDSVDG